MAKNTNFIIERSPWHLPLQRFLLINLLAFVLQHAGLMMSTLIPHTPVWFAAGTACAFIFLRGMNVLPGVAAGTFTAFYFIYHSTTIALFYTFVFVIQTFLALRLCYFFAIPTLVFYRSATLIQFLVLAFILTGSVTLLMAVVNHAPFSLWQQWCLADWIGMVSFGIGILTFDAYFPQSPLKSAQPAITMSLFGCLIGCIFICFFSSPSEALCFLLAITVGLNIIISIYLGWWGAVSAGFISTLLLGLGAYLNAPLFHTLPVSYLQTLLCFILITNLLIGVRAHEKAIA